MNHVIGKTQNDPVFSWEAVQPKPSTKPLYVKQAQEKVDALWKQYMDLCNIIPLPGPDLEELGDKIDVANIAYERAYSAWQSGEWADDHDLDRLMVEF